MREIIPNVLYQRGEFWKKSICEKENLLNSFGINIVVCLTNHKDNDLEVLLKENYLYIPIMDGKISRTDILFNNAKKVGDLIVEKKYKVLCHCRAGRNRSSLFSALLVIRMNKINGKNAVEYMYKKRPRSLNNDYFVEFLNKIERYSDLLGTYILK